MDVSSPFLPLLHLSCCRGKCVYTAESSRDRSLTLSTHSTTLRRTSTRHKLLLMLGLGLRPIGVQLARIEQIVRIERLFDRLHELDGAIAELIEEVLALPDSNAVLAGAYMRERGSCQTSKSDNWKRPASQAVRE